MIRRVLFLTSLLLARDGNTGIRATHSDGILSLDSIAVGLPLLQTGDVGVVVTDRFICDPVGLALFLVLQNKAGNLAPTRAVRPLPCQPHLRLVYICVVEVFGWARRI